MPANNSVAKLKEPIGRPKFRNLDDSWRPRLPNSSNLSSSR